MLQYGGPQHSYPGQFQRVFIDCIQAGLKGQPFDLLWRKQWQQHEGSQVCSGSPDGMPRMDTMRGPTTMGLSEAKLLVSSAAHLEHLEPSFT